MLKVLRRAGLKPATRQSSGITIPSGSPAEADFPRVCQLGAFSATAAALLFIMIIMALPAWAQDGHSRYHEWYRTWLQPGTTISCCNARVTTYGVEHGDCEPTRYEIRDGGWVAWLRQENRWLHIPDDRILRERNPSGEEGHLCYNTHTQQILCAVPPDTGG